MHKIGAPIDELRIYGGFYMDNYKYLSIVEWSKNYIADNMLREGDKFLSENELSSMHKVSRQTVRQALTVLENQNIISRVRGSGTYVKNNPGSEIIPGHVNIGLISTYFGDYIFPSIVTGIEKVLRKNNVGMQLAITRNKVYEESRALRSMIDQGVQALIIEPSKSAFPNQNEKLFEDIKAKNIPVVFFNAKYPWADFPVVSLDDAAAGKAATDYLFENGHNRICAIFAVDDIQGHERYRGFMESCIEHGLEKAEENVMWYSTQESAMLSSIFEVKIRKLLKSSGATAVVCYNDRVAIDFIGFCKSQGISVPDDLSVISIDDSTLAEMCDIPLTSVRHPQQLLGEKTAQLVIDLIKNPIRKVEDYYFNPEITVRDSVKEYK